MGDVSYGKLKFAVTISNPAYIYLGCILCANGNFPLLVIVLYNSYYVN